jgi:hypothetical protein
MIKNDFEINPEKKIIKYISKGSKKTYSVKELYSYIMDVFDEPEYMRFDLPIEALSKTKFKLINGWSIDKEAKKQLKGNLVTGKTSENI